MARPEPRPRKLAFFNGPLSSTGVSLLLEPQAPSESARGYFFVRVFFFFAVAFFLAAVVFFLAVVVFFFTGRVAFLAVVFFLADPAFPAAFFDLAVAFFLAPFRVPLAAEDVPCPKIRSQPCAYSGVAPIRTMGPLMVCFSQ